MVVRFRATEAWQRYFLTDAALQNIAQARTETSSDHAWTSFRQVNDGLTRSKISRSLEKAGKTEQTVLDSDAAIRLRKIWELGTDIIVAQTLVHIDGDTVRPFAARRYPCAALASSPRSCAFAARMPPDIANSAARTLADSNPVARLIVSLMAIHALRLSRPREPRQPYRCSLGRSSARRRGLRPGRPPFAARRAAGIQSQRPRREPVPLIVGVQTQFS